MVFVEFLKFYLIKHGIPKGEININPKLSNYERLSLLLCSIIDLNNGKIKLRAQKFYEKRKEIYTNDNIMIKFLLFLKNIYEESFNNFNDYYYRNPNFTINRDMKIETKENKGIMSSDNEEKRPSSPVIYHSKGNYKKTITSQHENSHEEVLTILTKDNDINDSTNQINYELSYQKNEVTGTLAQKEKISNNKNLNVSPNIMENKKNFKCVLSSNSSANFSINPKDIKTKSTNSHNLSDNKSNGSSIQYNKKKIAQIQLTTGIYNLSPSKNPYIDRYSCDSDFNQDIPMVIFYHPTNPIVDINLKLVRKMSPIFSKKKTKIVKTKNEQRYKPINQTSTQTNEIEIKKWLISLSLLPQKSMNVNLIKLLKNGVLFCDILNRCEGRHKVIQGVIRNPFTRSQMKINLTNACNYILKMTGIYPYINKIYINLEEEILNENEIVTYTLIDSLFKYYNKLKSLKVPKSSENREKIPKIDIFSTRIISKKESVTKEFREVQSASSRKNKAFGPLKPIKHKKQISNNINDEDTSIFLLNGSLSINSDNLLEQMLSQNENSPQPLTQISSISAIQKQKYCSPSDSNLSLIISRSNNTSSITNWKELNEEVNSGSKLFKKKTQKDSKKTKNCKGNFNCMILFKKDNLDKMKREILNRGKLIK